jgi:hypothetical protein
LLQQPTVHKDTVELQIQVLDGDKVLHSEDAKVHQVALLTAAEEGAGTRGCSRVLTFRFARRPIYSDGYGVNRLLKKAAFG